MQTEQAVSPGEAIGRRSRHLACYMGASINLLRPMYTRLRHAFGAAAVSLAGVSSAVAAPLVDRGPIGGYYGTYANTSYGQNFLVQVTFARDVVVTGFDVYTMPYFGAELNVPVTIKIRKDNAGVPMLTNLFSFEDTVDHTGGIGYQFYLGSDFAGVALTAGTYWFGMSGGREIGWSSYGLTGAPLDQDQLIGETLSHNPVISSLAYRILGQEAAQVPEPATLGLGVLALGLIAVSRARRQAKVGAIKA